MHTRRRTGIRNKVFRVRLGVTHMSNKIQDGRLRWFVHVRRRHMSTPVRRVEIMIVEGWRSKGTTRLTWDEQIRYDLIDLTLSENMINDRSN